MKKGGAINGTRPNPSWTKRPWVGERRLCIARPAGFWPWLVDTYYETKTSLAYTANGTSKWSHLWPVDFWIEPTARWGVKRFNRMRPELPPRGFMLRAGRLRLAVWTKRRPPRVVG